MSNITIKAKVKKKRQFFPKNNEKYTDGDFAIQSVEVTEEIEGHPKIHPTWGTITIVGNMPYLEHRQEYILVAKEIYDEKYKSYKYEILLLGDDLHDWTKDSESTKKFLTYILTDKQIENIFTTLENPTQVLINEDIETLCKVKGIGETTAKKIIKKIKINKDKSEAYIQLAHLGISKVFIDKLINYYKSPKIAVAKVKENPYVLANEVDGIGFTKADEIALKGGMSEYDGRRLEAFILYYLTLEAEDGRTFIPQQQLKTTLIKQIGKDIDINVLREVIYSMYDKKTLWWDEEKTIMALNHYRDLEKNIVDNINRILHSTQEYEYNNWEQIVKEIEQEQGWQHTVEQRNGIKTVLDKNFVVVTGLAGTGKTTVTNAISKILGKKYIIAQCALAGKAAQRMTEVTKLEAQTIHRLLRFTKGEGFTVNEENPLEHDILIIDEASMINSQLFLALLKAVPTGMKVIILGDYGQLSAIGAGNVFGELINSGAIPVVRLTEIHRQAQASAIISKSIDIKHQKQIIPNDFEGNVILGELQDLELDIKLDKAKLPDTIVNQFVKNLDKVSDIMDLQVIVPMKSKGDTSTFALNKALQRIYNLNITDINYTQGRVVSIAKGKDYYIHKGDKVINVKNNYQAIKLEGDTELNIPLFNGNVGIVLEVDTKEDIIVIEFIGVGTVKLKGKQIDNLELAYAVTCNKYQGSQSERVIVALDFSGYMLLSCEWLYTAITRASKYCVLTGESAAIRYAIRNVETKKKNSFISLYLTNSKKEELIF